MDKAMEHRLSELRDPFCSYELIDALYGLGDPPDDEVMGRYRAWYRRLRLRTDGERPDQVNRFWLETFFQRSRLLPKKWAAVRLGMAEESFDEVLDALDTDGIATRSEVQPVGSLVSEEKVRNFHELFRQTQRRVFSDNSDRCRRIHKAIGETYHVKVQPVYCVTSEALAEEPLLFAGHFDAINGDPVSVRYQVWLDLGKPMNLRPDGCSLKLYWAEREALRPLVFPGVEPLEERFADVTERLSAAA